MKRRISKLRERSQSPVADVKERIQELCREVVIERDGGCFLRFYPVPKCGGFRKDGQLILQFDHLNTRARNISFGDPRTGVCVCMYHHIFWKKQYPAEYEMYAMKFIGKKRALLVKRVREDKKSYRMGYQDWLKIEVALVQELHSMKKSDVV